MVVLRAELEVAEDDGDLGAGDDEDDEHEAEEAEEVVELVQPHAGQDEEELDEDRAKGQDAADEHTEGRVHVPGLRGQAQCSLSAADTGCVRCECGTATSGFVTALASPDSDGDSSSHSSGKQMRCVRPVCPLRTLSPR